MDGSYEELTAGPAGEVERVFTEYEALAAGADAAFRKVAADCAAQVKCHTGCRDCCHAVFGLFPVESVYLAYRFQALGGKARDEAIARAGRYDEELTAAQERWRGGGDVSAALAGERIRCPLLDGGRCRLYGGRPVTCRVYGIPTVIRGRTHVCGKSGFVPGGSFPTFNLDAAMQELYRLSGRLLAAAGHRDPEDAARTLLAVSRSLTRTPGELLRGECW